MTLSKFCIKTAVIVLPVLFVAAGTVVYATHSWGNYHWARNSNPFILKLGDNVTNTWDAYLGEASTDWSKSSILDTTVVSGGTTAKRCQATSGRVEVCSSKYGFNGWLGVASIWISGSHITKGTVKVNDSYFNTSTYNTPAWRRLVMCQEVGHEFGLDHQDENFSNPNLGSCMDYTSDPDGPFSNEHPNTHDYEQLEAIYSHLDSVMTVKQGLSNSLFNLGSLKESENEEIEEWGRAFRKDSRGRNSLYVRNLGGEEKVFTFILWAD